MSSARSYELLQSVTSYEEKVRKCLALVDRIITPYQLQKLKLLACFLLQGQVKDAGTVTKIFDLLSTHFANDVPRASSALRVMLRSAGVESRHLKNLRKSEHEKDIELNPGYLWRKTLVLYSDQAKKTNAPRVIDYLYTQYDVQISKESVTSLIALFDHLIETYQYIPGRKQDLDVLEKYFKTVNKYKCGKVFSMVTSTVCLLSFLVLAAVTGFYTIPSDDMHHCQQRVYYNGNVTIMGGKPFDLRYYDLVSTSIKTLDKYDNDAYDVSACQADCRSDVLVSSQINSYQEINFTHGRKYMKFDEFPQNTPAIFLLRNSHIEMTFTSQNSPGAYLTLNVFKDVQKCDFFKVRQNATPNRTIKLTPTRQFNYTFRPDTETGDYFCIVLDSPPGHAYTYNLSGTISQYRSNHSLCVAHLSRRIYVGHVNTINFTLQRPFTSVSKVQPQETCVFITFEKVEDCDYNICRVSVNTTLHGTRKNIKVVSLSTLGLIFLVVCCISLLLYCVIKCL